MKLSEFYDGIIKKEKEEPQIPISFDDMKIFKYLIKLIMKE